MGKKIIAFLVLFILVSEGGAISKFINPGAEAMEGQATCGNGLMEIGEDCDDGNDIDGDGCSAICQLEAQIRPCSDKLDNDGDGFFDSYDPGCHTDLDADNLASYDPDAENEYDIKRISIGEIGSEANGSSYSAVLSGDGHYVAFQSDADNLVPGDTNLQADAFVKNLMTGQVERVNITQDGGQSSDGISDVRVSSGGEYVAFTAYSNNLVSRPQAKTDVYVRDRSGNTTMLANLSSDGNMGNGISLHPSFGFSDKFIAFTSFSDNLVVDDKNNKSDVFLRNLYSGEVERISLSSDDMEADGDSRETSWMGSTVSTDGRYVIFISAASNLIPGEANAGGVYVRDRVNKETKRIFQSINSGKSFDIESLSITGDGSLVVFSSLAKGLVASDENNLMDVFVYAISTGEIKCLSLPQKSGANLWHSYAPSVSADGRFVVFESATEGLSEDDYDSYNDVFVYDLQKGEIALVSRSWDGNGAFGASGSPSISSDGSVISFVSVANNLVAGDSNGVMDIFMAPNPLTIKKSSDPLPVPTGLSQKGESSGAIGDDLGVGKILNEGQSESTKNIFLSAKVETATGAAVFLEVELKRIDESGQKLSTQFMKSEQIVNGAVATISYMPQGGLYAWRARTVDVSGHRSDWVDFGGNGPSEADFISSNFSFVFMTDVHLGSNLAPIASVFSGSWYESQSYPRFTDELYAIEKMNPQPDFILIGGDNVEYNNPIWLQDFKAITEGYTARTGIEIYFVPGNHERYDSESSAWDWEDGDFSGGNDYLANYFKVVGEPEKAVSMFEDDSAVMDAVYSEPQGYNRYNSYFYHDGFQIIGLDSGEDTGKWDIEPEGSGINKTVMEKLFLLAQETSDKPRIIFMHHPVYAIENDLEGEQVDSGEIAENEAITNNWTKFIEYCNDNNIQLILSGHTHDNPTFNYLGEVVELSIWEEDKTYPLYIQTQSAGKNSGVEYGHRIINVINGKAVPQESEKGIDQYEKIIVDFNKGDTLDSQILGSDGSEIGTGYGVAPAFNAPASDRTIFYEDVHDTKFEIKNNSSEMDHFDLLAEKREEGADMYEGVAGYVPASGYLVTNPGLCSSSNVLCSIFLAVRNDIGHTILDFADAKISGNTTYSVSVNWDKIEEAPAFLGANLLQGVELSVNGDALTSFVGLRYSQIIDLNSPGELRVYDQEGRMTGLIDGKVSEDIPYSIYVPETETVYIFGDSREDLSDGLRTQIVGSYEATYDLSITIADSGQEIDKIIIDDVLTNENTTHQFQIDWKDGSSENNKIFMEVDGNKDGIFEQSIISDGILSAPSAVLQTEKYEGIEGSEIFFDASDSSDADGSIMQYGWDLDADGLFETVSQLSVISHVFDDDFDGLIRLRVTDDQGLVGITTVQVSIKNASPQIGNMELELVDMMGTFVLTANFVDQGARDIHTAEIDWGDGDIEKISDLTEQNTVSDDVGKISAFHKYAALDSYVVKLTVVDDDGGSAVSEIAIKSPRHMAQDALIRLKAIQFEDRGVQKDFNKAIESLEESLGDVYWQDDFHIELLGSPRFYARERKAMKLLEKIVDSHGKYPEFQSELAVRRVIDELKDYESLLAKTMRY